MRILVVGGGIGGLTSALALRQAGLTPTCTSRLSFCAKWARVRDRQDTVRLRHGRHRPVRTRRGEHFEPRREQPHHRLSPRVDLARDALTDQFSERGRHRTTVRGAASDA